LITLSAWATLPDLHKSVRRKANWHEQSLRESANEVASFYKSMRLIGFQICPGSQRILFSDVRFVNALFFELAGTCSMSGPTCVALHRWTSVGEAANALAVTDSLD
jgi:hypothetical protein